MKNMKHVMGGCFLIAVATATGLTTGCKTGDRTSESTGEYIDAANTTRKVKSALGDDVYKYPDVKVTTFKNTTQLSGFVATQEQKTKAGEIAKAVPGVGTVVNNITVSSDANSSTMGSMVDDTTLTHRVKSALDKDDYKYPDVQVTTRNGNVQLSGFVDDPAQKDKAAELAKNVPGVKDVINNITVKSTP